MKSHYRCYHFQHLNYLSRWRTIIDLHLAHFRLTSHQNPNHNDIPFHNLYNIIVEIFTCFTNCFKINTSNIASKGCKNSVRKHSKIICDKKKIFKNLEYCLEVFYLLLREL